MTATLDRFEYAAREFEAVRPPTWRQIARPEQLAPDGDWLVWAYVAGRGAGKTRSAAEWVNEKAKLNPGVRIALVGRTPADVRDVMIEGESGILACAGKQRPIYESTKRKLTWPNGSTAHAYSAEVPAQLRGPQHHFSWCFPAGTMIRTPGGQRPIETLAPGDMVLTRSGPRRVMQTGSRIAEIATVHHGGGALTGTLDHPIWTENRGWIPLSGLVGGDKLYTWTKNGSATPGATTTGTQTAGSSGGIARPGKRPSALYRPDSTFIIATISPGTTGQPTSLSSPLPSIGSITPAIVPSAPAEYVAQSSSTRRKVGRRCTAQVASGRRARRAESSASATANNAAPDSRPGAPDSVVSGVSISGLVGRVYNLSVEAEHEYFADDVLVHNCDEPAAWTDARKGDVLDTAWNNLMLGLRLGSNPQCVATTTPKPNALIRLLLARASTVISRGSTYDNLANLAPSFREQVLTTYEGTRIGRQELLGELLEDVEGALWTLERIDAGRVSTAPDMQRVVVAVDPSGGSGPNNDEQGIVVAGLGVDGGLYVLADRSCRLSPHGWASRAIAAYHEFKADRIVAERNYGGEMVESTILQVDKNVPVKVISASRGKVQRAEPIAALYEHTPPRVHHVGPMPQLEDQLTTWTPQDGTSPDRLDGMVWALTELTDGLGATAWIEYMKRKAEAVGAEFGPVVKPVEDLQSAEPESAPEPELDDPAARLRAARTANLRAQRR